MERKILRRLLLLVGALTIFYLTEVVSVSISEVSVTKKDSLPSFPKALSKISIPKVPVPEFPKFAARPNKNPSNSNNNQNQNQHSNNSSSDNPNNSNKENNNNKDKPSSSSPSTNSQQQPPVSASASPSQPHSPILYQPNSHNPQAPPSIIVSPAADSRPSLLQEHAELSNALQQDDIIIGGAGVVVGVNVAEHEFESGGFTPLIEEPVPLQLPLPSLPISPPQEIVKDTPAVNMVFPSLPVKPAKPVMENAPMPPKISLNGVVPPSPQSNKNDTGNRVPSVNGEKVQATQDFPMPAHVLSILQALGGKGSLAQASKPEKDGTGSGYTNANAIGYATGDNATVTASVSNKMEVNPQTVIFTESASASASSMSNGTAFSQATLSNNGWANQLGGGNGWTVPGNGWAKILNSFDSLNKRKERKLFYPYHNLIAPMIIN